MPIIIKIASHAAEIIEEHCISIKDPLELLEGACPNEHKNCKELLQIFLYSSAFITYLSFVQWLRSHRDRSLQQPLSFGIRPEDVWFAIIAQLSFYINRHAEELRGKFVPFEGEKELVKLFFGNRYTVDFWTNSKNFYDSD